MSKGKIPKKQRPLCVSADHLERFSDTLWGLCAANSLLPLHELSTKNMGVAEYNEIWPRLLMTSLVFWSVVRNYACNRRLVSCYGSFWRARVATVPGGLIWLVTGYTSLWFVVGAVQYRPELAVAAIGATALMGLVVVGQERKLLIEPATGPEGQAVADDAREMKDLHRDWLWIDGITVLLALLATLVLWPRQIPNGTQSVFERVAGLPPIAFPIAILFLVNLVDLVWHKRLYFAGFGENESPPLPSAPGDGNPERGISGETEAATP
jgi:hypothetical protein